VPLFLDPGSHVVEGRRDGYELGRETVDVSAGGRYDLTLTLVPLQQRPATPAGRSATPAAPIVAEADASGSDREFQIWPIVVGGAVTAAALGTGIGFVLAANGKEADREQIAEELTRRAPGRTPSNVCRPPVNPEQCNQIRLIADDEQRFRNIATVGFIGAGVAGAATLAYALFWPREGRGANTSKSAPRPAVSVRTHTGAVSVSVSGRF